jgi:hypothetical protein
MSENHQLHNLAMPVSQARPELEIRRPTPPAENSPNGEIETNVRGVSKMEIVKTVQEKATPALAQQEARLYPENPSSYKPNHSFTNQTYNPSRLEAGLYRDLGYHIIGKSPSPYEISQAPRASQQGASDGTTMLKRLEGTLVKSIPDMARE